MGKPFDIDKDIFKSCMPFGKFDENMLNIVKMAASTDDVTGSTLRTHLICEQIIEAWIYASCRKTGFFTDTQAQFSHKATMAKNLGMPITVHNVLKSINSLRNKLAHFDNKELQLNPKVLEDIRNHFREILRERKDGWGDNPGMNIYDQEGNPEVQLNLNDDVPAHHKVALIASLTGVYLLHRVFDT